MSTARGRVAALGATMLFAVTSLVMATSAQAIPPAPLLGTFKITGGSCAGSTVSGSYFRMIQPGGKVGSGPFLGNPDSPCTTKSYTPLRPGSDGGLKTGRYQKEPTPAFTTIGGGKAHAITQPQRFFGIYFATATNAVDPQTRHTTKLPAISVDTAGKLTGDLRAFAVSWNRQHFNQGSPKPDGSRPGITTKVSGTYNAVTRKFTITWVSQIVGGPFNNFAGSWHLTGTFIPA